MSTYFEDRFRGYSCNFNLLEKLVNNKCEASDYYAWVRDTYKQYYATANEEQKGRFIIRYYKSKKLMYSSAQMLVEAKVAKRNECVVAYYYLIYYALFQAMQANLIICTAYDDEKVLQLSHENVKKFFDEQFCKTKKCPLDGDIVVENDLRQMYLVDLENDYLAAVKQDYHLFSKDFIERTISKLEVDNLSGYFFAGDIVMNLKKMREDKMTERFLEALGKGYLSEDQDILYKFCREKVKYISLTYTFCNRYINESKFLSTDIYSREEIEDALQYPVIIHFAGGNMKPWNNLRCKAAEKWWNYAKNVLEDETFKEIYDIAKKKTEERDFDYLISGLDKTRNKVIIFGFSMIGKMLCDDLMKFGYNVVSFFDNNESFWGKKYNGCFVEKPKKINDENRPNLKVIIAAQGRLNVILDQLSVLGYEESAIIKYAAKNAIYYMGLDEKFYEHELREMTRRECGREDGDIKEKLKRNFSYLNEKYYLDFWNVIEER